MDGRETRQLRKIKKLIDKALQFDKDNVTIASLVNRYDVPDNVPNAFHRTAIN